MTNDSQSDGGDNFFDDDVPWADASIRRDYEAALGAFILAFNQLDNLLGKILRITLTNLGRADLIGSNVNNAPFTRRVFLLDILKQSTEGAPIIGVSIDQLLSVAGERNILAHAHFEQNPFDGGYSLVGNKDQVVQEYSAERINQASENVSRVWRALRYVEARFDFADVSITPPSDDPTTPK